jgi:hypothetical protein
MDDTKVSISRSTLAIAVAQLERWSFYISSEQDTFRDVRACIRAMEATLTPPSVPIPYQSTESQDYSNLIAHELPISHHRPMDWFFALCGNEDGPEFTRYRLYICLKKDWSQNNNRFVWSSPYPQNDVVREALGTFEDSDGGLYWYEGDESKMYEHRSRLIEIGMTENLEILNTLSDRSVGERTEHDQEWM